MKIKHIKNKKLPEALPLIWDVFCKYEAVNYPEDSKKAFYEAIHSREYLSSLDAYGAFEDDKLIGIIATRNEGTHIALFFVDGAYHRMGIGRKLWNEVLSENLSDIITVHSSFFAVEIYRKLGFEKVSEPQCEGGIQFVLMEYHSSINPDCPCKKVKCIRHGRCNECHARHANSKREKLVYCEREEN